jgi:hypothetical protein
MLSEEELENLAKNAQKLFIKHNPEIYEQFPEEFSIEAFKKELLEINEISEHFSKFKKEK